MYKVGMYGGTFNPLHLGHVNDIIKASNQCEELYVVLSVMNNFLEIEEDKEVLNMCKEIFGKQLIIIDGIDYRENHPCIYEKQVKIVPKIFSIDEEYEVVVPSMEETLAEKLCIIAESTKTDVLNTRTKDFYDIYHLHGGDYDLDKFSYYFEKMLQDRGKVRDIYSLNTDYLNNDFIERHESVWESNKRHYEFLDDDVDLKGAVYYTKSTLNEQFQRIRQGKNKVYKI